MYLCWESGFIYSISLQGSTAIGIVPWMINILLKRTEGSFQLVILLIVALVFGFGIAGFSGTAMIAH